MINTYPISEFKIPLGKNSFTVKFSHANDVESLVIFSHPRIKNQLSIDQKIAAELHKKKIGAVFIELLTSAEDKIYSKKYDHELLGQRLICITEKISEKREFKEMSLGYFASDMDAAFTMIAAAALPQKINTMVLSSARSDLGIDVADKIKSPTLFLLSELNHALYNLNNRVYKKMKCPAVLDVIPGSKDFLHEENNLEEAAHETAEWFSSQLKNHEQYVLTHSY